MHIISLSLKKDEIKEKLCLDPWGNPLVLRAH